MVPMRFTLYNGSAALHRHCDSVKFSEMKFDCQHLSTILVDYSADSRYCTSRISLLKILVLIFKLLSLINK